MTGYLSRNGAVRGTALVFAAAMSALVAAAPTWTVATATADPESATLCPEGALTSVPDGRLQCRAGMWQPRADRNPAAQWLTYGPPVTLSGTRRPDPEIAAGTWLAQPQEPRTRCRVEQLPAADAPELTTGNPGQPITVQFSPMLDSVTLSGDCLWRRVG